MSLDHLRKAVLARFEFKTTESYEIGKFKPQDPNDWLKLTEDVKAWWVEYKDWERGDTIAKAYEQQRLTVKGTSTMDLPISAQIEDQWGRGHEFNKPKAAVKGIGAQWAQNAPPEPYRIKKTNASIRERLKPEVFVPAQGGSRKTDLGLHDLSAGLMNPKVPISEQQYKTPEAKQTYVFMPLSAAGDQALFQNINQLGKQFRNEQPAFYELIRDIRSKMTRIKLAAEHDMATSFYVVKGTEKELRPQFKFGLLGNTSVSKFDLQRKHITDGTKFEEENKNVVTMPTTPEIRQARQLAAINFQTLVLGQMNSYGEVVISYREHAGSFPKFATFANGVWTVISCGKNIRAPVPSESFTDRPA